MADDRLIPAGILDESALALNELIDRMATVDISPLLIYLVDNLTASALPHLAEQFHVTGYEGWIQATSEGEQRALLKTALLNHRYKGTPFAIVNVLASVSMVATISEWFDYSGDPYHFRVGIDLLGQEMPTERLALVDLLIQQFKNVRSVLDGVDITFNLDSPVPTWGAAMHSSELITVYPL